MGNSCCAGRSTEKKMTVNEKPEKLSEVKSKPPKSKNLKSQNAMKSIAQVDSPFMKKTTWQDVLSTNQTSKLQGEEHSLVYSSDSNQENSEIEEQQAMNADLVLSNHSEIPEGLDYTLVMPKNLSKLQQNQIVSALDKYRTLLPSDEQEEVDGLAPVTQQNKKFMIMLSTHAIYLLTADDFSVVDKRIQIEDLSIIFIPKSKDGMLIGLKIDYVENLLIKCENFENIFKAIQQLHFEAIGKYLPWVTKNSFSDVSKLVKSKNFEKEGVFSAEFDKIFQILVENGGIGESKVIFEKCSDSFESNQKNIYFLMTENCIYTISDTDSLQNKFLLGKIEKININKKNQYIVIYEEGGVHIYTIKVSYADQIKQFAGKLGNKVKIIEE